MNINQLEIDKIKNDISNLIGVKERDIEVNYQKPPKVIDLIKKEKALTILTDEQKSEILRLIPEIIDHTLLKPFATKRDIEKLCKEALQYNFLSVCVNSSNVGLAKKIIRGSNVKVSSTVGFPLGAINMKAKLFEARSAIEDGADEIDVVVNIGKIKDREYNYVYDELKEIVLLNDKVVVKVIIENCYLTNEEKVIASYLVKLSGAHFVKTSTGFGEYGAKIEDVQLMRQVIGSSMGIKAAGGIRSFEDVFNMVMAGATRIGTSSSVNIIKG